MAMSSDGFRTVDIGLIASRDGEKMAETARKFGYIDVQIELIRSEMIDPEEFHPSIVLYYDLNRTKNF